MTNRQQSAFFFVIIFLFTSGIGLVIYRQYDQYYQQKAEIDLEAASTTQVPAKKASASTALIQVNDWKTYKNDEYGFEFQYPNNFYLIDSCTNPSDGFLRSVCINKPQNNNGTDDFLGVFQINVISNLTNLSLDEWSNKYYTSDRYAKVTKEAINFGNNAALKINSVTSGDMQFPFSTIAIKHNGYIYTIITYPFVTDAITVSTKISDTFKLTK